MKAVLVHQKCDKALDGAKALPFEMFDVDNVEVL